LDAGQQRRAPISGQGHRRERVKNADATRYAEDRRQKAKGRKRPVKPTIFANSTG